MSHPTTTLPSLVALLAMSGLVVFFALAGLPACGAGPECASSDYGGAECRIATSAELARLEIDGFVLAFEPRSGSDPYAHTESGLFRQEDSAVIAQVATLGDFEITIDGSAATEPTTLVMVLANVGPATSVIAEPVDRPQDLVDVTAAPGELHRGVTLDLAAGESWAIRGTTYCPQRYRVAVFADTQTDMGVLQAIVDRLDQESAEADAAGEPLLGALLVGDLTDVGTIEEIVAVREMLQAGSVPVAATVGNHDVYTADVDVFNREIGPGNLRFDLCETRLVVLDTGDAGLAPSIEARLTALLDGAGADQLLVATHYPPYSSRLGNGWSHEDQQTRALAEIAAAGPDMTFAGHVHNLTEFPEVPVGDSSFHQVIVGTGGGFQGEVTAPRFGYLRVTLGDTLERCFVQVQLPDEGDPEPQREDEPPMCP